MSVLHTFVRQSGGGFVLSCICLSVHVHELAMLNQYACLCDWVHGWV